MTQISSQGPVVQVKPQPDIYTVILIVGVLALAVTIGIVMYNLMAAPPNGYGLTFGQFFESLEKLIPGM